jgi:hypothetical protein
MSIGCSCLEFVAEFDLLDGSISGVVFDLRECLDIGICLHGFKES